MSSCLICQVPVGLPAGMSQEQQNGVLQYLKANPKAAGQPWRVRQLAVRCYHRQQRHLLSGTCLKEQDFGSHVTCAVCTSWNIYCNVV